MARASQLFGSQVYSRGAMTLEALRTSIGAADFAEVMEQWQEQYAGTSKRTTDFIALAEEISGRDLDEFFETWIYTTGKPAWPAKFDLRLSGPAQRPVPGDTASFSLSSTNTGKVVQTGSIATVDLSDVLAGATLGTLPAGTALEGATLIWTVPSTAIGGTSSVSIPFMVKAGTTGTTIAATARATTLGATCVACASSVSVSTGSAPTVSGTLQVGHTVTASPGTWDSGVALTYQWLRNGKPITGATGSTYALVAADRRAKVSVVVTGSKTGYTPLSRTSATGAAVKTGKQSRRPKPAIRGTARVHRTLKVKKATYDKGVRLSYTWYANGHRVGSNRPSLKVSTAYRGKRITVRVTAKKPGYVSWTSTSAKTSKVR
jgi:hypothetical protein